VPFTPEAQASLRASLRALLGGNGDLTITLVDYEISATVATVPHALTAALEAALEAALAESLALSGEQSVALTSVGSAAPARRLQRRRTMADTPAVATHALRVHGFGIDASAAMAVAGRMASAVPAAGAAVGINTLLSSPPVLSAVVTITASTQGSGTGFGTLLQAAIASPTLLARLPPGPIVLPTRLMPPPPPLLPTMPPSMPTSPPSTLSAGTIAGAAAGVGVALLLSACMLVCCLRSRMAPNVPASAKPRPGAVSSAAADETLSDLFQQRRGDALLRLADPDCVGESRRAALLLVVQLEIFEAVSSRCQTHSTSSICGAGASIAFALLLAACSSLCCVRRREPRRIPRADLEDAPKNPFAAVSNERRREALLRLADTECVGASRRDALVSLLQAELSMRAVSRGGALFTHAAKIAETLPCRKVEVLIPVAHDNGIIDSGVSALVTQVAEVHGRMAKPPPLQAAVADTAAHTMLSVVVALDVVASDVLSAEALRAQARRRRRRRLPEAATSSAPAPEAAGMFLAAPPHKALNDVQQASALAAGAPA
jgi:hypothetical protein